MKGPVELCLSAPPEVVAVGVGVHGNPAVERWLLPDLLALHLYDYHGEVLVQGDAHPIAPGTLSVIPAGSLMEFHFRGPSEHLYAHLRLPTTGPVVPVPVVQQLSNAEAVRERLHGIAVAPEPHRSAELWSILWQAASGAGEFSPAINGSVVKGHPAVVAATAFIEANLAQSIAVADIARAANVSASHLNRLFRDVVGSGVAAHVRRRRARRVAHLLRESTQSMSSIAASVGIHDLQDFNKFCRTQLGASPRRFRAAPDAPDRP